MLRSLLVAAALLLQYVSYGLSDSVNVTSISGVISGSGYVANACGLATPGCVGNPPLLSTQFTFSGDNPGQPYFVVSGMTINPIGGELQAYGSQQLLPSNYGTGEILRLLSSGNYDLLGGPGYYGVTWNNNTSVDFSLTTASMINLDINPLMQVGPLSSGGDAEVLDSGGDVLVAVSSPDGFGSADLQPGTYQLDFSTRGDLFGHVLGPRQGGYVMNVDAVIQPIPTPEPGWSVFAALVPLLGCQVMRRLNPSRQRSGIARSI